MSEEIVSCFTCGHPQQPPYQFPLWRFADGFIAHTCSFGCKDELEVFHGKAERFAIQ